MKKIFIFSILNISFSLRAQGIVNLGTGNWHPYTSEDLKGGGPVTMIIKKTLSEMGMNAKIEYFPWERSKKLLEKGLLKGSFPWRISDERLEKFIFSNPIMKTNSGLFYLKKTFPNPSIYPFLKKGHISWRVLKKINLEVCGVRTYKTAEDLEKNRINHRIVSKDSLCAKLLDKEKVIFYASDYLAGLNSLVEIFGSKFTDFGFLSGPWEQAPLHFIAKKGIENEEFIKKFNKALRRVKGSQWYLNLIKSQQIN